MIGTISAAQSACCTGVRMPWSTYLLSSASTSGVMAYGTDLQNRGGTDGSTSIFALKFLIVPNSGLKISEYWVNTACN